MASSTQFVEYIAGQLEDMPALVYKKLFGEYGLWCGGKFFGTVEDDQFYVKITAAGKEMMPDAQPVAPHGGNPGMYLVEELEDREFLRELVRRTCEALPAPGAGKRKRKGKSAGTENKI